MPTEGDQPLRADRLFRCAHALARDEQFQAAARKFQEAADADPRLGMVNGDQPGLADRLIHWADALRRAGGFRLAAAKFQEAAEANSRLGVPESDQKELAARLVSWADALHFANRFDLAAVKFQEAADSDLRLGAPEIDQPLLADRLFRWAHALARDEQFHPAIRKFEKAADADPRLGVPNGEQSRFADRLARWADALLHAKAPMSALEKTEAALNIMRVPKLRETSMFLDLLLLHSNVLRGLGRRAESLSTCQEAAGLASAAVGERHPIHAIIWRRLADLGFELDRKEGVYECLRQAVDAEDWLIARALRVSATEARRAICGEMTFDLPLFMAFQQSSDSEVPLWALQLVLRRKALLNEWSAAFAEVAAASPGASEVTARLFQQWREFRLEWMSAVLRAPGTATPGEQRAVHGLKLEMLQAQITSLEQQIGEQAFAPFRFEESILSVSINEVARALPAGVGLVEYVRCAGFKWESNPTTNSAGLQPAEERFYAFVLRPGMLPGVYMFDLGPAGAIEAAVRDLRDALTAAGNALSAQTGSTISGAALSSQLSQRWEAVRRRVWDPLRTGLGNVQDWIVAPDGVLNLVPFELVAAPSRISYVGTGREVLRFQRPRMQEVGPPAVLANPDYDLEQQPLRRPAAKVHSNGFERFKRSVAMGLEGSNVASRLRAQVCTGKEATKTWLQSLRAPSALHLATHGFYVPFDPKAEPALLDSKQVKSPLQLRRFKEPLLRSGLALAGANRALSGETLPPGVGNGFLLAVDIANLNVLGTELVVLSACETGLGEEAGTPEEGLVGLRQAFVYAGARTVICSLWRVPDAATTLLMEHFYGELIRGVTTEKALRTAKQAVKARHASPICWAGFILYGDPTSQLFQRPPQSPA